MRFTTISSSIAAVVNRVFGFAAAGMGVRTGLHHWLPGLMREPLQVDSGYQPEPWLLERAADEHQTLVQRLANSILGKPQMSWHRSQLALAVCPTPAASAATAAISARVRRRG
jgi:hypothetical protein